MPCVRISCWPEVARKGHPDRPTGSKNLQAIMYVGKFSRRLPSFSALSAFGKMKSEWREGNRRPLPNLAGWKFESDLSSSSWPSYAGVLLLGALTEFTICMRCRALVCQAKSLADPN